MAPTKDELMQLASAIERIDWSYNGYETIETRRWVHDRFGEEPNDLAAELERSLNAKMSAMGLPNRYNDALTKKAGTAVSTQDLTAQEVFPYLSTIGLQDRAVILVEKAGKTNSNVYVTFNTGIPASLTSPILKAINRLLPPAVNLRQLPARTGAGSALIKKYPVYALQLVPTYGVGEVSTLEGTGAVSVAKAQVEMVFPVQIRKSAPQQIVTGAVLVPEEPDRTKSKFINTKGEEEVAEGDVYSEEVIQRAMYYWMEEGNHQYAFVHKDDGGLDLIDGADVAILENWQARADYMEGEQQIKKGTWMNTSHVHHRRLWEAIEAGQINSFSVAATALAKIERQEVVLEEDEEDEDAA